MGSDLGLMPFQRVNGSDPRKGDAKRRELANKSVEAEQKQPACDFNWAEIVCPGSTVIFIRATNGSCR